MLEQFILLAAVFQIKHWIADYILQTEYMLGKFKAKDWVDPLVAHCKVHAGFTALIIIWWFWPGFKKDLDLDKAILVSKYAPLAFLDFGLHFAMDRLKASPKLLGKFKPISSAEMSEVLYANDNKPRERYKTKLRNNKIFRWSLGFDQMFHHLTHYLIIYLVLKQLW